MSMIKLSGVSKIYQLGDTQIRAVSDAALEIDRGEFVVLWGPSGSGKTSLLNLIGLLDKPNTGTLTILGREVSEASESELAQLRKENFGYVFQGFNLIDVLSAEENVMLPLQILGVNDSEARKRALDLLGEVGVRDLAKNRPKKMSGGQQQRVAIARALVTEPSLVLADEPTANLDSDTGQHIISLMRKLNEEKGTTFVFSTHDPNLVKSARRVVKMKDGCITSDEVAQ